MLDFSRFYTLIPSITRGGQYKLPFARPKTTLRRNFFTIRAGLAYLRFSETSLSIGSMTSFKSALAKHVLSA